MNQQTLPEESIESPTHETALLAQESQPQPVLSTTRRVFALGLVWFGTLLTALDETMIATITGTISSDLDAYDDLSWITTAYLIAQAASQPLSGHLTDIFGRKEGFMVCQSIFLLGTLLCGLSNSKTTFIAGRIVQGFGGGSIGTIGSIIENDLIPTRQRSLTQGIGNIAYGVALAAGGVYGGLVKDYLGWKAAFTIQVPVIAASMILVFLFIDLPKTDTDVSTLRRIDYGGIVSIIAAIVLLQFGLTAGSTAYDWSSPVVVITLAISALSLLTFAFIEAKVAREPLLPLGLFRIRTIASSCLASFFTTTCYFSSLFYVPIYLQVLGNSTSGVGLRFLPQAAGVALGSFITGCIIHKTGRYYRLTIAWQGIFIAGFALLASLEISTPSWLPYIYLGMTGLGFGGQLTLTLIALLSSAKATGNWEQQSVLMSALWSSRATGMTIGLSIASVIFHEVLGKRLREAFGHLPDARELIRSVQKDFGAVQRLKKSIKGPAVASFMTALRFVFVGNLVEAILASFCSLLFTDHEIPKE